MIRWPGALSISKKPVVARFYSILVSLHALGLLAPSSRALAGDVRAIREQEFLDAVARNDPRLRLLQAQVTAAHAEVAEVRVLPNPSLGYIREETFTSGQAFPENYVTLAWPIDLSGRRSLRIEAAEIGVLATSKEAAVDRLGLMLEALALYYDAAALRLRSEVLSLSRQKLGRLVDIVQKRLVAGEASGYDMNRLELELAAYDDFISTNHNELEKARSLLGLYLDDSTTRYDAADSLELPTLPASLALLGARALAKRGDYQASKLRSEQATRELARARRGWIPTLVLSGGLKTSDLGTQTAYGYTAGASLSLPFFDYGQADEQRALAASERAQALMTVFEKRVPLLVRTAHQELERRLRQAEHFASNELSRLDELTRSAEASYREGEQSIFELIDAYRTEREVRLRAIELRRDAKRSALELWRALGELPQGRVAR